MTKVRFLPNFTGNPYQKELSKALSNLDVFVDDSNDKYLDSNEIRKIISTDILHLHWVSPYILGSANNNFLQSVLCSYNFFRLLTRLRSQGVRVVWTVHNFLSHERFHEQLELNARRILVRYCDAIFVHCNTAATMVHKHYWVPYHKIHTIQHGNYINSYLNNTSKEEAKTLLRLESKVVYLVFGQIRGYKDIIGVVNAFINIKSTSATLLIAGKPVDKNIIKILEQRCKNQPNIRLIFQYVPDNEVQLFMNAADIIICPYKSILTSGMVVLAMSFGKLIIAPDIGCIKDTTGTSGVLLYNHNEYNSLESSMILALKLSSNERLKLGESTKSLAQKYDWLKIAKNTKNVYQKIISH